MLSWYVFVLSHRAQDCDYSHKDPSRPSDCTEVTAVVHPIEGDELEHNQVTNTGDCLPLYQLVVAPAAFLSEANQTSGEPRA